MGSCDADPCSEKNTSAILPAVTSSSRFCRVMELSSPSGFPRVLRRRSRPPGLSPPTGSSSMDFPWGGGGNCAFCSDVVKLRRAMPERWRSLRPRGRWSGRSLVEVSTPGTESTSGVLWPSLPAGMMVVWRMVDFLGKVVQIELHDAIWHFSIWLDYAIKENAQTTFCNSPQILWS